MDELSKEFHHLKGLDIGRYPVSLWILRRKLSKKRASYAALRVEAEERLRAKLRESIVTTIGIRKVSRPYFYGVGDQENVSYELATGMTDFRGIRDQIESGSREKKVTDVSELVGAWGYVIQLSHENGNVYGFRKISAGWSAKKVRGLISLIFEKEVLIDLEERPVFKIDESIDFVCLHNELFVFDRSQFESAMNFRAEMEARKGEVIQEIQALDLFTDVAPFRRKVDNIRALRKIAQIQENGYYRNPAFMQGLKETSQNQKWGLAFEDEKIVVDDDNVELIMTLINNDRLSSLINSEIFDVEGKTRVQ